MENYVTTRIDVIRKNLEDLATERETVIRDLAEYGWELVNEKMLVTSFARTKNKNPEVVSINYIREAEDWMLFATGWLESGELLTFLDYIDIRRMLDNM